MKDYDLELISGTFFNDDLPKDKRYMYRYLSGPGQKVFVRYYHTFRQCLKFTEHTGHRATRATLQLWERKFNELELVYAQAKIDLDFEQVGLIESGKYKLKAKKRKD